MSYSESAQECKRVAERCLLKGEYNSAANRFYYCLYTRAKELLIENNFDYAGFLRGVFSDNRWRNERNYFSHKTICRALTNCLWNGTVNAPVEDFAEKWESIYTLRLQADYTDIRILSEDIMKCRNKFYTLWEKMNNG